MLASLAGSTVFIAFTLIEFSKVETIELCSNSFVASANFFSAAMNRFVRGLWKHSPPIKSITGQMLNVHQRAWPGSRSTMAFFSHCDSSLPVACHPLCVLFTLWAININVKLLLKSFCLEKFPVVSFGGKKSSGNGSSKTAYICKLGEKRHNQKLWHKLWVRVVEKGREFLTEIFTSFWLKHPIIICFSCCVYQSFFGKAKGSKLTRSGRHKSLNIIEFLLLESLIIISVFFVFFFPFFILYSKTK